MIELLVLIAVISVSVGIGQWLGRMMTRESLMDEAIRVGVAHKKMTVDGKVEVVWNVSNVVTVVTNKLVIGR